MTAKDFLESKNIKEPTYEAVRLVDDKMGDYRIVELLEEYHQAKLKLLGITNAGDSLSNEIDLKQVLHISNVNKFQWERFLNYVNTYNPKKLADDKVDTIVKDLLYGIAISLDDSFKFADGYKRFMDDLKANF